MDDLAELLSRLVSIDSVNPALVPGGAGEGEISAFVADWAGEHGLEATVVEATAGRPSVIVRARGTGGGRTLMLCGHLDTVGAGGMAEPHFARPDGDRLHGRGAYDMKAGLAAALVACRESAGLAGDVVVACVADEEHASLGVQEVLESVSADAAIVTEPTHGEVIIAHKGFVWSRLTFHGRAAHGSRVEEGIDAIAAAGPALVRLRALDASLGVIEHPLLGRGSVHASLISGGVELSSYPGECVLSIERRTLPGETAESVEAEISGLIAGTNATARTLLVREPFAIDPGAEIVQLVRDAAGGAAVAGAPYWTDAAFIAAAGIPTVLYGPARRRCPRRRGVGEPLLDRGRCAHARRRRPRVLRMNLNPAYDPRAVPAPSDEALAFHRAMDGYEPTPLVALGEGVWLKDESHRFGLPAFKVLGASWAVERALRADPSIHTLVAASAGNHGRAVAHVAARRGLRARVYLPARSVAARREAIAREGAEVIVVDGTYEDAVARAGADGAQAGSFELADVGESGPAEWVIDGYATLFTEVDDAFAAGSCRVLPEIVVPVGVGSLGAAAARYGAHRGASVIAVEPETAACLTASLAAGEPTQIATPGTTMAGLDCAEVSLAAWPTLRAGIRGTITVSDAETHQAMRELAAAGLTIGDSGAATKAAPGQAARPWRRAADRHGGRDRPRGLPRGDRVIAAEIPVRRNTLLLAACMAVYSSVLQLVAAVSSITFVLVTGVTGLLGLGPAIFLVASALAAVPAGRMMDRIGRKPVIAFGYVLAACGCSLTALATNLDSAPVVIARLRDDRRGQRDRAADPHRRGRHVPA